MGGVRSFYIESKFFQLILEEGGRYYRLQIYERGKFFMRSVFLGKLAAQWLMANLEHLVVGVNPKQFFTYREGDTAFTLQRSSNSFGQFLLLTELKVGGSRRSVFIPVGKERNGWRTFGLELNLFLQSLQLFGKNKTRRAMERVTIPPILDFIDKPIRLEPHILKPKRACPPRHSPHLHLNWEMV